MNEYKDVYDEMIALCESDIKYFKEEILLCEEAIKNLRLNLKNKSDVYKCENCGSVSSRL